MLLWLREESISLPATVHCPGVHSVLWRAPVYNTILHILTNPVYAGAYAFGRTETRVRIEDGRKRVVRGVRRNREQWQVLILGHHDGYIDWPTYEHNQRVIADNTNMGLYAQTRYFSDGGVSGRSGLSAIAGCATGRRRRQRGEESLHAPISVPGARADYEFSGYVDAAALRGNRTTNEMPSCSVDSTAMEPPCATAISLAMYSPRPSPDEPLWRSVPERGLCLNGSKSVRRASGGIDPP